MMNIKIISFLILLLLTFSIITSSGIAIISNIKSEKINNVQMDVLSMGMSADFEIAIQKVQRWFELVLRFLVPGVIKINFYYNYL